MNSKWLLPGLLIVLASCNLQTGTELPTSGGTENSPASQPLLSAPQTETKTKPPTEEPKAQKKAVSGKLSAPAAENRTISANGIGNAKLGMTLGELKQTLGESFQFSESQPFMVDLDAIAVSKDGQVHYYILHWSSETFTDADKIEFLLTDNSQYRTPEGIGAGTSVSAAASVYGEAKLNYNTDNESREYVQFAQSPAPSLSFRSDGHPGKFAGVYTKALDGSYHETKQFRENATIDSIMLDANRL